ncbi:MAG: cytochrome c3 family protein [Acidobacteria bacterium]|nr:cytochrome c3 family protein [Acidobacteriota bacterium]MBI3658839.1 cytochrome c3 family protein [Acidobacteriota bacterium]
MQANKFRIIGLVLVAGLLAFTWLRIGLSKSTEIRQPIRFNHKKHVQGGLECSGCHQTVKDQATAGRPETSLCMTCHEASVTKNPEENLIREYAQRHEEIPWQRVIKLPDHVFFSHRRHVSTEKLDCTSCHEAIGQSSEPPSRPIKFSMDSCLACHQKMKASVDCVACHK